MTRETCVQCDDTVEKYMTINNPTKGNAPYRGGREKSWAIYCTHTSQTKPFISL